MEEEMTGPSTPFGHEMLGDEIHNVDSMPIMEYMVGGDMESYPSSEDKVLVLHKPVDNTHLGPLNPSIIISPDLIRGLKSGLEDISPGCSNCLALVPWTPPQIATISNWSASNSENTEFFEVPMESDEAEVDYMDVEESPEATIAAIDGEGLHQWQ